MGLGLFIVKILFECIGVILSFLNLIYEIVFYSGVIVEVFWLCKVIEV